MKNQNTDDIKLFLSTPSARRATYNPIGRR